MCDRSNLRWVSTTLGVSALLIVSPAYPSGQLQAAVARRHEVGSGNIHEEDRTSTTGPSGSRPFATSTGSIDASTRVAKPAGDYAVTAADRGIAIRVRSTLNCDPSLSVNDDNLRAKVDNGHLILRGWVDSQRDKNAIGAKVQELEGVQGVDNQLEVVSR
jgi:osmotically-inducible protein OsmY